MGSGGAVSVPSGEHNPLENGSIPLLPTSKIKSGYGGRDLCGRDISKSG